MSERFPNDVDPIETRDWLQAIESVIREEGVDRAQFIIEQVLSEARKGGVRVLLLVHLVVLTLHQHNCCSKMSLHTLVQWTRAPYSLCNSLERSNDCSACVYKDLDLGGHMASSSYQQPCMSLFNHFFRS
ncbi:hypothetical protein ACLK1S_00725 [Escherichia coli]